MHHAALLLLALLTAGVLSSTDPVRPGDASLATTALTAGADTLVLFVIEEGEAQMVGFMTLQTRRQQDELVRVEEMVGLNGRPMHRDSFAVEAASLAPRYQVSTEGSRTFEGDAFYANSADLVLGSLPLAEGYEAQLALTGEAEGDSTVVATVAVLLREDVQTVDGGSCSAWRVLIDRGASRGFYWISSDARKLVQYVSPEAGYAVVRRHGCPTPS